MTSRAEHGLACCQASCRTSKALELLISSEWVMRGVQASIETAAAASIVFLCRNGRYRHAAAFAKCHRNMEGY